MSVNAPQGFVAVGGYAGIKAGKVHDVAVVATADGRAVPAAGVFTANLAAAAPVRVSRAHLAATGGRAAGVILTSGNANAATGAPGRAAAERLCTAVAGDIGATAEEILVCQTGLIGIPFPIDAVMPEIEPIVMARTDRRDSASEAARAIMTTDTVPKEVVVSGDGFTVGGMAKGAAMLAPNMATMLALCTTDAAVDPSTLHEALQRGGGHLLQRHHGRRLHVDQRHGARAGERARREPVAGCADRRADRGVPVARRADGRRRRRERRRCPTCTCAVRPATRRRTRRRARWRTPCSCSAPSSGRTPTGVASSRELGSAGTPFDIDRVSVAYGGTVVCAGGVAVPHDGGAVAAHMAGRHVVLECDLGLGAGEAVVLGTDLGYGYIDENRTTS